MYYWILWLCIALVLLFIEIITIDLFAIWFAIAALVLVIITAIFQELHLVWQAAIFLSLSAILLVSTRKLVKRLMQRRSGSETNLELILNHTGIVTEDVNNDLAKGAVKINSIVWSARSLDGAEIPANTLVTVCKIDGNKLIVKTKE